jgi:plasmid stabilization system protein ParE
VRSPAAIRDLGEIADFIGHDRPQAALRFIDAAESASALLARMAGAGAFFDRDDSEFENLRFMPIPGFAKYLLFYKASEGEITLLRVIHGGRDLRSALREG